MQRRPEIIYLKNNPVPPPLEIELWTRKLTRYNSPAPWLDYTLSIIWELPR